VARVSATSRAAPLGDPVEPFRSLDAAMTGARSATVMVEINALIPRTPQYPNPAPCLACPWTSMIVSSTSTRTSPPIPANNGVAAFRPVNTRQATASIAGRGRGRRGCRRRGAGVDGDDVQIVDAVGAGEQTTQDAGEFADRVGGAGFDPFIDEPDVSLQQIRQARLAAPPVLHQQRRI